MQTNTPRADAETIAALTAQCALLASSLKQAETEGCEAARKAADELEDCAGLYKEHSTWQLALFQAIEHYTATDEYCTDALTIGPRETVAQLAGIGVYIADSAWAAAKGYKVKAEAARVAI